METVKREIFGDTEVLIMPIEEDEKFSYDGENGLEYTATTTKMAEKMQNVIRAVAEGISEELEKIQNVIRPSVVEMNISLGFSEKSNVWIIGVKGEQKISLKLIWNCESRRNSDDANQTKP